MSDYKILVSHGSPNAKANAKFVNLIDRLSFESGKRYISAFLQFSEPRLDSVINNCASNGPCRISIVPFFLSNGRHVQEDIPRIVDRAKSCFLDAQIEIHTEIGSTQEFYNACLSLLDRHENISKLSMN